MALTTTAFNACGVKVELKDAGGTFRDISGSSNEISVDFDNDLGEFKAFRETWKARLECGQDASFKLSIISSTAANEAWDILKNWYFGARGRRDIRIKFPDESTGLDQIDASVVVEKASIPLKADEAKPVMIAVDLKPYGEVSLSAQA